MFTSDKFGIMKKVWVAPKFAWVFPYYVTEKTRTNYFNISKYSLFKHSGNVGGLWTRNGVKKVEVESQPTSYKLYYLFSIILLFSHINFLALLSSLKWHDYTFLKDSCEN